MQPHFSTVRAMSAESQLRKYRWSGIKLLLDNDRTEA